MNKNGLKATVGRAEKLKCGVLITEHNLSVLKVTEENGFRRTTITKFEPYSSKTHPSDREKWEPAFNQFLPALKALELKIVYTDECAKLVYDEEETLEIFYYRSREVERMANYLSNFYLEKTDGVDGAIKIRPRFWEDEISNSLNRELDIFEANAAKSVEDYKKLAERLWCRLSATEQEGCFRDFSGEIKQRLMEVMACLR